MKNTCYLALLTGLCVSAMAAPVPEHFSDAAKQHLADSIELNTPEEVGEVKHMLNVIYFIGSDGKPVPDYERRISELLLYAQQFYGKEMARNGFGKRSFALPMKPNGNVDITVIRGKKPAEEYKYSGAAAAVCLGEIAEYFKAHPESNRGQHNFVIMPTLHNAEYNDDNPGGVPFFGYGRHCFALDYKEFDIKHLGKSSRYGHLLTKWFGGFAHELGHGLNMPHNKGIPSENAKYGTALMGAGNYTFGMKPTYMTKASCSILDVCEVFPSREHTKTFYERPAVPLQTIKSRAVYTGDAFVVQFRLPVAAAQGLKHTIVYVQDPPYAVNQDYDAVPFCAQVQKDQSEVLVTCNVPVSELSDLQSDARMFSAIFLMDNGFRYRWQAEFSMKNLKTGEAVDLLNESFRESGY